ncbi:MAG: tRNA (guanosine(37)-N1)-methyltransferase TrmD [Phycisphaerales bacterium]|nr:tRNA (guanosine(37)-N1)-methyltransferase TrmD [Phycisphaerales bacterium]
MRIDVLTLFPEALDPFFSASIIGRAQTAGCVSIRSTNIRDFALDARGTVDDRPFGGGPGMVLMCQPLFDAVEKLETEEPVPATRILLTPQGEPLNQALCRELAALPRLLVICGHYEGFDERIRLGLRPREISIGDYVLSGGEAAAMVLIDAVVRLLPGALGDEESCNDESFSHGLLEYPQYTRPRVFREMDVPDILLSGDHARIEQWRREQAVERTARRRPDLLDKWKQDKVDDSSMKE